MGLQVATIIGGLSQVDCETRDVFSSLLFSDFSFFFSSFAKVEQSRVLDSRPHVVVATPGRLAELLSLGGLSLAKLSFLVLDEADRLLSLGFEAELKVVLQKCPSKRQTMLFSATMSPTIRTLEGMALRDPFRFDQASGSALLTVKTLRQEYMLVPEACRDAYVVYLARSYSDDNVSLIVFCATVEDCAQVHHMLESLLESQVVSLHSLMSQPQRLRSLTEFRNGRAKVLVATDVAARGLDIPMTDLVVNCSVPSDPATYVHRVGRTARAGRSGCSITLVSQFEVGLMLAVEDQIGMKLAEHPHKEEEVLKFLPEANAARGVAALWWEEQGLAERNEKRKDEGRKRRKKQSSRN